MSDESAEKQAVQALRLLARERIQGGVLAALWQTHFVDRRVKSALVDLVESADAGLVRLIKKRSGDLTSNQVRESLARDRRRVDQAE